jgi:hypothetical protein
MPLFLLATAKIRIFIMTIIRKYGFEQRITGLCQLDPASIDLERARPEIGHASDTFGSFLGPYSFFRNGGKEKNGK